MKVENEKRKCDQNIGDHNQPQLNTEKGEPFLKNRLKKKLRIMDALMDTDPSVRYHDGLRRGVPLSELLALAVLSNQFDDAKRICKMIEKRRVLVSMYNKRVVRDFEKYVRKVHGGHCWFYLHTLETELIDSMIDAFITRKLLNATHRSMQEDNRKKTEYISSLTHNARDITHKKRNDRFFNNIKSIKTPPLKKGDTKGNHHRESVKQTTKKRPYESFQSSEEIARDGVKISWKNDQRPPQRWKGRTNYYRREHVEGIRKQIQEEVALGRISEIHPKEAKHIAPLGSVTRSSDKTKPRPIMDMRLLNSHLEHYAIDLPRKEQIIKAIQGMKWGIVKDLKNGYYNLKLSNESIGWCSFEFEGKCYTYNVLCFGLSTAPAAFITVTRDVVEKSRAESTMVYVDEFLIMGRTRGECLRNSKLLEKEIHSRSMVFNEKKSMAEPSQILDFIGYKLDLKQGLVYNKDSRIQKLNSEWQKMKYSTTLTKGKLMRFLGKLNFAVTNKKHFIYLNDAYSLAHLSNKSERSERISMNNLIAFNVERALRGITLPHQLSIFSKPLIKAPKHIIHTDASGWACSVIRSNGTTSTKLAIKMPVELQRIRQASTFKEALAILLAVLMSENNDTIRVMTDSMNICDVYNSKKQIFKSKKINRLWLLILEKLEEKNITLDICFIKGSENPADKPSRLRSLDDWGYRFVEKTYSNPDGATILDAKDILVEGGVYDQVIHATREYPAMEEKIQPHPR